jgi:hypothetical protein
MYSSISFRIYRTFYRGVLLNTGRAFHEIAGRGFSWGRGDSGGFREKGVEYYPRWMIEAR